LVFLSQPREEIPEVLVLRVLRSLSGFELSDPFFELWKTSLAYVDSTEPRTQITRSHGTQVIAYTQVEDERKPKKAQEKDKNIECH
jgi:hypothetical protein